MIDLEDEKDKELYQAHSMLHIEWTVCASKFFFFESIRLWSLRLWDGCASNWLAGMELLVHPIYIIFDWAIEAQLHSMTWDVYYAIASTGFRKNVKGIDSRMPVVDNHYPTGPRKYILCSTRGYAPARKQDFDFFKHHCQRLINTLPPRFLGSYGWGCMIGISEV